MEDPAVLSRSGADTQRVVVEDAKSPAKGRRAPKLLPFMTRTLVALTLFFFVASCLQLLYLHVKILDGPNVSTADAFSLLLDHRPESPADVLSASRLKALVLLEVHAIEREYHQAGVLLMARVWTSYLGFVTGMILALVGAAFILGKVREPASELSTKLQNVDVTIRSMSPGLVLAVLGTVLMVTTIVTHHRINVVHRSVYLRDVDVTSVVEPPARPPLDPPALGDGNTTEPPGDRTTE